MGKKDKYLSINQVVVCEDGITPEMLDSFVDDFLELIDKYNMMAAGGFSITKETFFRKYDEEMI